MRALCPSSYAEASIRVLKGLEPVKQRPGMYTRTDNPLHIVQEVIDNAADEALAGVRQAHRVTLHADGSVSVDDDGRGIPFGLHPRSRCRCWRSSSRGCTPAASSTRARAAPTASAGGLHGVGVSVTNALAKRLQVTVWREGQVATLAFAGGDVIEPLVLRKAAAGERKARHQRAGVARPEVLRERRAAAPRPAHLLRSKAVLMPGVTVSLTMEKTGETQTWLYKGGLRDYLMQTLAADPLIPLFEGEQYAGAGETENFAEGEGAAWCVAFTDDGQRAARELRQPDPHGGRRHARIGPEGRPVRRHQGLHRPARAAAQGREADARGRVLARQLRAVGQGAGPAVPGPDQGAAEQRDALRLVSAYVKPALELWLNQHVDLGKKLAELVIRQAQTRQRASQKVEEAQGLRRGRAARQADRLRKPRPAAFNEVFLVEGDSAGGSAKMGRNKETQAVLPLRGKVLNTWEVERDRLFANNEIHDIAVAIGVDPHGPERRARPERACATARSASCRRRRRRLAHPGAAADAVLPPLPQADRARPHLHRPAAAVPHRRAGAGQAPAAKLYALDEGELDAALDKLRKEGAREGSWSISRFKGLGEMNAEQLWETTLNPETRRLLPVSFGARGFDATVAALTKLMGKGEAARARELMELRGDGRGRRVMPRSRCLNRRPPGEGCACGPTMLSDLDFVVSVETDTAQPALHHALGAPQHEGAVRFPDFRHFIVETGADFERAGFVILQGCRNPHRSVELKRIVLQPRPGQGLGRACVRLLKRMAFRDLHAHRFWLDVKSLNERALALYRRKVSSRKAGCAKACAAATATTR
jgi:topoisomerase-4 subunit B